MWETLYIPLLELLTSSFMVDLSLYIIEDTVIASLGVFSSLGKSL